MKILGVIIQFLFGLLLIVGIGVLILVIALIGKYLFDEYRKETK